MYGSLGDTLTTTTGMRALTDQIKAAAGAQVFADNYDLDHQGPLRLVSNPVINFVRRRRDAARQQHGIWHPGRDRQAVDGRQLFRGTGWCLVIGDGEVDFRGGGNGQINGQMLRLQDLDDHSTKNLLSEIGSPELSWAGGGGNGVFYNHCWADDMLSKFSFLPPPATKQLKVLSTRTVIY